MVHITGNFLLESPLSPTVREALGDAIDQGWGDPRKLAHSASRARILQDQSRACLAHHLELHPEEVEFLGEPGLGHFYSIGGLLGVEETLVYSHTDRKEVFAIARGARGEHGSAQLDVHSSGRISIQSLEAYANAHGVFALQGANGETGVVQDVEALVAHCGNLRIACDYSSAGTRVPLPSRWDAAFFDARSWQGPQGVGILAIRNRAAWKNPMPHIGNTRTPHTASLPLVIAAAVALEEWATNEVQENGRLRLLSKKLRDEITGSIENCDVAGNLDQSLPHITSFSFLYVEGEELLRKLDIRGFAVDSGSACTAEDLQPSHVLAAMGLLTHGNIRITLHHGTTPEQVSELAESIRIAVTQLREP